MLPDGQRWDGLTECVPEIGVLGAATVTRPPGGVDAELHQVREPAKLICARRRTAWKSTKLVQIDLLSALGGQVFVDEHFVASVRLRYCHGCIATCRCPAAEGPACTRISSVAFAG